MVGGREARQRCGGQTTATLPIAKSIGGWDASVDRRVDGGKGDGDGASNVVSKCL